MLCKECGADVNSSEVFCPVCGAPLRVTADYDYIQAEIGVKVDQVMNDEPETEAESSVSNTLTAEETALQNTLNLVADRSPKKEEQPAPEKKAPEKKKENLENTIAVTRTIFIKDSIFADEDTPDTDEEKEAVKKERERSYRVSREARKRRAAERAKKKRKLIILIAAIAVVVIGAVVGIIIATSSNKTEEAAATGDLITCSIENGGTYSTPLEITLWSDQDSRLVYTLDGSEPGVSTGTKYAQPIELTNDDVTGESSEITLTVYAYKKDASIKIGEYKAVFTLIKAQLAPPTFDLEGGDYYEPTYINITAPEGTTIYYTYDGSTPSTNSTQYTGSIEMKRGNNILSAIAVDANGTTSEVTSAVYNLAIQSNISYDEAVGNVVYTLKEQSLIAGDADEHGFYTVPDGGTRRVINGGTTVIDNVNYYVLQVDYMNDGSNVQATTYYGVNDQTGVVYVLNRSGMTFVLA